MEVIYLRKDMCFYTRFTEGYVIAELSFGSMGDLHIIGNVEFMGSYLQELFCDTAGGPELLSGFKARLIGSLKLILKKVSKA